jgi:hypothetical protein
MSKYVPICKRKNYSSKMSLMEKERDRIRADKPCTLEKLLELMRNHASMLEVYEYVEAFEKQLPAQAKTPEQILRITRMPHGFKKDLWVKLSDITGDEPK